MISMNLVTPEAAAKNELYLSNPPLAPLNRLEPVTLSFQWSALTTEATAAASTASAKAAPKLKYYLVRIRGWVGLSFL